MSVSMNPEALGRGAAQVTNHADEVGGQAAAVADVMAFLAPAFGGAGRLVWPGLAEQMTVVERELRARQEQAMTTGGGMGAVAQGGTAVDQASANAVGTGPT